MVSPPFRLVGMEVPSKPIQGGVMKKILVIDDEPGIRGLLATILERKGYAVLLADGGRKGLDLFRRERPDLIVLDLKMPDIDGIAVLKDIHAIAADTPVVILTGAGNEQMEQQARELGAAEFIEKEFSLHRLGESLRRLL
jgi:DNA-binding NtrC family response regulator